jgi:hypothetical protein
MSRTPPDHAAAAIYSEGDFIYLQLHATKGYTQELSFPATPRGMAALLRLLRQREMALATAPQKIAAPTMPIQHVIDTWVKDPSIESKALRAKELADKERFARKPLKQKLEDLTELFNDPNFDF